MALQFTHPDKILYPEEKITKKDVAEYWFSVQHLMIPYIRNRLLSLVRCPDGYKKGCFFQKHIMEKDVKGIETLHVKGTPGHEPYLYLKNKSGFLYLAQMAVLEIHPWGSHIKDVDKPDIVLFDLDPAPSVDWKHVVHIAHLIRSELEKLKLVSFVKTTGGKGLHIVIPIRPHYSWDEIRIFARSFAKYIAERQPALCTESMAQSKKRGKIFIDYVRNARGATAVAPYSLRARSGAPVSTPLHWEELTAKIHSNSYTIKNFAQRLKKIQKDPWEDFYHTRQSLRF